LREVPRGFGFWLWWFAFPYFYWLWRYWYFPWWTWIYGYPWPYILPKEQEIALLEDQKRLLEEALSDVSKRLEELRGK